MSKGNVSSIHLPPQEQIRQLRGIVAKQNFAINELTGKNQLMNEIVNLCVLMAYKNGGEVTITEEDRKIVDGAKVKKHTNQENHSTTYSIELRKEEEVPEVPEKEKEVLELVK